jgi:hypothetical protein
MIRDIEFAFLRNSTNHQFIRKKLNAIVFRFSKSQNFLSEFFNIELLQKVILIESEKLLFR